MGSVTSISRVACVAVCPVGHSHPKIVEAITKQAQTLIHVSNWYCIEGQADLAEVLVEKVMEIPGKCFFCNSGAEANEGLIKLARKFGQATGERFEIISFSGSFHGRTFGAMTATAQEKIHGGFGPLPPGFVYAKFNDIEDLKSKITDKTCALLLEPIQGESGVNAVKPEFLRAAQALCREKNLLLLLDEVQCSFGRAGELAGWRSIVPGDEIVPDGVSWAKAIGSGYPLGSFWIRDVEIRNAKSEGTQLASLLGPGTHGTTYGGSPLACAVGLATIDLIISEGLCANANRIGAHIAEVVRGWKHPLITELRQKGLFIGFVLDSAKIEAQSNGAAASIYLAKKLLEAGLMTVPAGPGVVRWLSPLNITMAEADEALGIQKAVLDALVQR